MKGIILAAGRGSRMGELTAESPKCLVQIAGKSLLDYQLTAMYEAGVKDIAVVTGYAHHMIEDARISKTFINTNWEHTNMVCSLMMADEWLCQEPCIISYADIFYSADVIRTLINCNGEIAITYDPNFLDLWRARFKDPLSDLENFKVGPLHKLLTIGERATALDDIQGQYMGLIKIRPLGWSNILTRLRSLDQAALNRLDMTSLLKHLLADDQTILAYPYYGQWGEVDNADDLSLYNSWFIDSENLISEQEDN